MRLEIFVIVTFACSFLGFMLVRNNHIYLGLAFPIIPLILILLFLDSQRPYIDIWLGGELLVIGYLWFELHNKLKPVRRYPGALSKYKENPDVSKWTSEDIQNYQSIYLAGTDESNKALLELVLADMKAVRKVFLPYSAGMKGGHRVALYVVPNEGCLWDIEDKEGNWLRLQNRYTGTFAEATSTAPQSDDDEDKQKVLVGYFLVK